MRSQLDPIKKLVKTVRNHQPLILNYFKAKKQYSSGVVEGLNRKVNLVTRKAFGFRSYEVLKIALLHTMGDLPDLQNPPCPTCGKKIGVSLPVTEKVGQCPRCHMKYGYSINRKNKVTLELKPLSNRYWCFRVIR